LRFTDHERFRAFCVIGVGLASQLAGEKPTDHPRLEEIMKTSNRDKVEETLPEMKGKVKEVAGEVKKVFGK
jgi:hypothetical protein